MSHTLGSHGYTMSFNSDLSGEVRVVRNSTDDVFNIEGAALIELVSDYLRQEMINNIREIMYNEGEDFDLLNTKLLEIDQMGVNEFCKFLTKI